MNRREFQEELAARLRAERVVLGLTQADVASALHVAESTVSRWENGSAPGLYDMRMLRRYFDDRAASLSISRTQMKQAILELRAGLEQVPA